MSAPQHHRWFVHVAFGKMSIPLQDKQTPHNALCELCELVEEAQQSTSVPHLRDISRKFVETFLATESELNVKMWTEAITRTIMHPSSKYHLLMSIVDNDNDTNSNCNCKCKCNSNSSNSNSVSNSNSNTKEV